MMINLMKDKRSEDAANKIIDIITGKNIRYTENKASTFNREGVCEGELVGGNLSLLFALAGTPSDITTNNKILFIEDLDEYLYHIDRMMMQLKRSGKLKNLKGLIVGGMSDMRDNAIPFGKSAVEIISEAVAEYNYPVCFDFPSGHIDRNLPLVFGATVKLVVGEKVDLTFYMIQHLEVGAQGELIARNFLENLGYEISEQNWRFKHKEIDLIALDKNDLVIIEVKTRRSKRHGETEDFISYKKINFLAKPPANM